MCEFMYLMSELCDLYNHTYCNSETSLFSSCYRAHRDLHSFPTRRSSDLDLRVSGGRGHRPPGRGGGHLALHAARAEIGRAQSELQSPDHLVCRLLLEKKKFPTPLPRSSAPLPVRRLGML